MENSNKKMGGYSLEILEANTPKPKELMMVKDDPSIISFLIEGKELLRLDPDGFWIRGKKTVSDKKIYQAFKSWLEEATDESI